MQGGGSMGIDRSHVRFLQNHPSIEELNWSPTGNPCIPADVLPNLKSLTSNRQFIMALDDPSLITTGGVSSSLLTPPSTPITANPPKASTPEPDEPADPIPESPRICRSIESLDIHSLDARMLLDLKSLNKTALRRLKLHTFGDLSTLYEIAEMFPNIEWLSLPALHLPSDTSYPVLLTKVLTMIRFLLRVLMLFRQEQWLDILPRFPKLKVFRGQGLWSAVKSESLHFMGAKDDQRAFQIMHELIIELVQNCPSLIEVDHRDFYEKYDAFRRIVITRTGDNGEHVSYGVSRPNPRCV